MSTKKLDSAQIAKLVADAGKSVSIADADLRKLLARIADILPPLDGAEEEKPPATKKQFVVLLSDPLRKMPEGEDFAAWVLQLPEEASPMSTAERIEKAAYDFNATPRGRKLPVQTVGETLENVPAKALKEVELWRKTKHPVLVVITRNEIPNTPGLFTDDASAVDLKRADAIRGFQKLCKNSGATVEIRTGEHSVTITADGCAAAAAKIGGGA